LELRIIYPYLFFWVKRELTLIVVPAACINKAVVNPGNCLYPRFPGVRKYVIIAASVHPVDLKALTIPDTP
jgi:hypothetical protein